MQEIIETGRKALSEEERQAEIKKISDSLETTEPVVNPYDMCSGNYEVYQVSFENVDSNDVRTWEHFQDHLIMGRSTS